MYSMLLFQSVRESGELQETREFPLVIIDAFYHVSKRAEEILPSKRGTDTGRLTEKREEKWAPRTETDSAVFFL